MKCIKVTTASYTWYMHLRKPLENNFLFNSLNKCVQGIEMLHLNLN